MKIEVVIESLEEAKYADSVNADRVELCSALDGGGLTPSFGLIKACVDACNLEVHAMIRHRAGHFYYNDAEIQIMLSDIEAAKNAGAHGVVFGVLNRQDEINVEANKILLDKTKSLGMEATCHRAIDHSRNQVESTNTVAELGFDRILTSGGASRAIEGRDVIRQMAQKSAGRVQIMAGSGVDGNNAQELLRTGVDALHMSIRNAFPIYRDDQMGAIYGINKTKMRAFLEAVNR